MALGINFRTLKDFATGLPYKLGLLDYGNGTFVALQALTDASGNPINPASAEQVGTMGAAPPTLPASSTGLMGLLQWLGGLLLGTLRTAPAAGTLVDHSTTTVAASSQALMNGNSLRQAWAIQAPSAADLWFNPIGGTAGIGLPGCYRIAAGTIQRSSAAAIEQGPFTYYCATGGLTLACYEMLGPSAADFATPAAIALLGGTIDGTTIGGSVPAAGTFTALTATGSVTVPANALANAALAKMAGLTLKANISGTLGTPTDSSLTAILDAMVGSVPGSIVGRGASAWGIQTPTAAGQVPTYNGTTTAFAALPAVPPRSAVRQTVQAGPQSSGAPSFLPSTAASLTLTAQNVSTGTSALVIAAAQGFGATGQTDVITQITSNPTWSSLTASAINYLYVNASTGATGATTLAPIYQFGGTLAVTNGQFTFDKQAMVGYLGNGTSAVATPLVFVGQATTSASAVTATIAYAYNGTYVGAWTQNLPGLGAVISNADNIGVLDDVVVTLELQCTTADSNSNYAAGATLNTGFIAYNSANSAFYSLVPYKTGLNTCAFVTGSTSAAILAINATTGAGPNNLTQNSWKYRLKAKRWGVPA